MCVCLSVQESVFEDLAAKQSVFQAVEHLVGSEVILSSSTSCLLPSKVFSAVQMPNRCIVSHPVSTCPGSHLEAQRVGEQQQEEEEEVQ